MKSVIKPFIFSFVMIASLASCSALPSGASKNGRSQSKVDENPQGLEFYPLDDGNYMVAKGTSIFLSEVYIPETYKDGYVVGIVDEGFIGNNSTMTRYYEMPSTIRSIGRHAFYNCPYLEKVVLSDNLDIIEESAFAECQSLFSIYIPKNVYYIGPYTFDGCRNLTIMCEAEEQPESWDYNWNYNGGNVVWGA